MTISVKLFYGLDSEFQDRPEQTFAVSHCGKLKRILDDIDSDVAMYIPEFAWGGEFIRKGSKFNTQAYLNEVFMHLEGFESFDLSIHIVLLEDGGLYHFDNDGEVVGFGKKNILVRLSQEDVFLAGSDGD